MEGSMEEVMKEEDTEGRRYERKKVETGGRRSGRRSGWRNQRTLKK